MSFRLPMPGSGLCRAARARRSSPRLPLVAAVVQTLEGRTFLTAATFELLIDPAIQQAGRSQASILRPSAQKGNGRLEIAVGTGSESSTSGTQSLASGAFNINIVPTPALASNSAALAAFERAAGLWEARISDPITVNIDADFSNLGSSGVIGQTGSVQLEAPYSTLRAQMVADAADETDDAIVASLPSSATFLMPNRISYSGNTSATKANLKALGFTGLDEQFGASDAEIAFNSQFAFDFDNSDGVTAGRMDFETVAAHEIGHALGFISNVDLADYYVRYGVRTAIPASTLDLFRFSNNVSGADPATAAQFASYSRSLRPNSDAVTDDIDGWLTSSAENRMSTGAYTGDGRQASHWKDGDLTGTRIGLLDPTLGYAQAWGISDADWRSLDLIGWDIADQAGPPPANRAPDAVDDAASTSKSALLAVASPGLLANDTDPDGNPLTATAIVDGTSSLGARINVNADGGYTYDPTTSATLAALGASSTAVDTFTYQVSDGLDGFDTATVRVTVTGFAPGDGLRFDYYTDANFTTLAQRTTDANGIDENWGNGSPISTATKDNFSARWTGQIMAPATGQYTFYARVDDNVRLWIDRGDGSDPLLIRRWVTANTSEWQSVPVTLVAGQKYRMQMDFRELSGQASARLSWSSNAGLAKQVVPPTYLFTHASEPAPYVDPYLADKNKKNDKIIIGTLSGSAITAAMANSISSSVLDEQEPSRAVSVLN